MAPAASTEYRDLFLSHRSTDKNLVRRIAAAIESEDWNGRRLLTWFDEAETHFGGSIAATEVQYVKNPKQVCSRGSMQRASRSILIAFGGACLLSGCAGHPVDCAVGIYHADCAPGSKAYMVEHAQVTAHVEQALAAAQSICTHDGYSHNTTAWQHCVDEQQKVLLQQESHSSADLAR